jgi:hypothetical protein
VNHDSDAVSLQVLAAPHYPFHTALQLPTRTRARENETLKTIIFETFEVIPQLSDAEQGPLEIMIYKSLGVDLW